MVREPANLPLRDSRTMTPGSQNNKGSAPLIRTHGVLPVPPVELMFSTNATEGNRQGIGGAVIIIGHIMNNLYILQAYLDGEWRFISIDGEPAWWNKRKAKAAAKQYSKDNKCDVRLWEYKYERMGVIASAKQGAW